MDCPNKHTCPLFPKLKVMSNFWKRLYCEGRFQKCERYKRLSRGEQVPWHMLPNGEKLAG